MTYFVQNCESSSSSKLFAQECFASTNQFQGKVAFSLSYLSFKFVDVAGTVDTPNAIGYAQHVRDEVVDRWKSAPHYFENVF